MTANKQQSIERGAVLRPDALEVGSTYGKWYVVGEAEGNGRRVYHCRCSCSQTAVVSSYDLRSGKSTQCRSCSLINNKHAKKKI